MATIAYALVRVAKTPTLSVKVMVSHRVSIFRGIEDRTHSFEFSNCARTAMLNCDSTIEDCGVHCAIVRAGDRVGLNARDGCVRSRIVIGDYNRWNELCRIFIDL